MSDLEDAVKQIRMYGPNRVLVDHDGLAVSCRRAREDFGVMPDVIFIRKDGWSLGAPSKLEALASRLWADQWLAILRRNHATAVPYVHRNILPRRYAHDRTT